MVISRHLVWVAAGLFGLNFTPHITPAYGKDAPSAPPTAAPDRTAGDKVDLNTSTAKELEALPGVGEATAKKIIAGRPYKSVDDLSTAGISEKEIARIAPLVTVARKSHATGGRRRLTTRK